MRFVVTSVDRLGTGAIAVFREIAWTAGAVVAVVLAAVQPRHWPRTARQAFMRQLYAAGVQGSAFVAILAMLIGLTLIFRAVMWLDIVGQKEFIGKVLALGLVRQTAPILVNLIVIGRSGAAITSELGTMTATGQVRALDAQGVDPFLYLIMPRAVALSLSVLLLYALFVVVAVTLGYGIGHLMGHTALPLGRFMNMVLQQLTPADAVALPLKTLLPGMVTAVICSRQGLSVPSITGLSRNVPRGFVASVMALALIDVTVSICLYG